MEEKTSLRLKNMTGFIKGHTKCKTWDEDPIAFVYASNQFSFVMVDKQSTVKTTTFHRPTTQLSSFCFSVLSPSHAFDCVWIDSEMIGWNAGHVMLVDHGSLTRAAKNINDVISDCVEQKCGISIIGNFCCRICDNF